MDYDNIMENLVMVMFGFVGVYILARFVVIGLLLDCQRRRRQEEPRSIPTAEEVVETV